MKKSLKRTLSLFTAAAIVSAGAVMPTSAAETTVLGTTKSYSFKVSGNDGTIGKVFYMSSPDSNPENVSQKGSVSLGHEWGAQRGAKIVLDFSPYADDMEFVKSVKMLPNGYLRDNMGIIATTDEELSVNDDGTLTVDGKTYSLWFKTEANGQYKYYTYSTDLKTVLVPTVMPAGVKYSELYYDVNTKTGNAVCESGEGINTSENATALTRVYSENDINYITKNGGTRVVFDYNAESVDITENVKNILSNGGTMVAYNFWPSPDDTNLYSHELIGVKYDITYYDETEVLANYKTTDKPYEYLKLALTADELAAYDGLSEVDKNSIITSTKDAAYSSLEEFKTAVINMISEIKDGELLTAAVAALNKKDSSADSYILSALGEGSKEYAKFNRINNKTFVYESMLGSVLNTYAQFKSAAAAAVAAYKGDNLADEDKYTDTASKYFEFYDGIVKKNDNSGIISYSSSSKDITHNYGNLSAAKLQFATDFIMHPDFIKTVTVTANVKSREPNHKDVQMKSYLVDTVAGYDDASKEVLTEAGTKYYSDEYTMGNQWSSFEIGGFDITESVKTRMAESGYNGTVAYNMINDAPSDWYNVYSVGTGTSFKVTVEYYNDYDFANMTLTEDKVGEAIRFVCGDDIYASYIKLTDKTKVNETALKNYATKQAFADAVTTEVKNGYISVINSAKTESDVTDILADLFGTNSDLYKTYSGFIRKDDIVKALTAGGFETVDEFKETAQTEIEKYAANPTYPEDKASRTVNVFKKDSFSTDYMYIYSNGNVRLDANGNKSYDASNINSGYNISMKFVAENIEVPYFEYVKSAGLSFEAWSSRSDMGAYTDTAYSFITKSQKEDTQEAKWADALVNAYAKSEVSIGMPNVGGNYDFVFSYDITSDIKALENGQGSLYYMIHPQKIDNGNFVDFRFRNVPKINVTYKNAYDLYTLYKAADDRKKAEIIDVFAFIYDIELAQNSETIAAGLNTDSFDDFENGILKYKQYDVTIGTIEKTETGYTVDITSHKNGQQPIFAVACAYGENNKMLTSVVFDKTAIDSKATESFAFDFASTDGISEIKVFCWNSSDIMKPYCENRTYTVTK